MSQSEPTAAPDAAPTYVATSRFYVEQREYTTGREFTTDEVGAGAIDGLLRTGKAVSKAEFDPAAYEPEVVTVDDPAAALIDAGVDEDVAAKLLAASIVTPQEVIDAEQAGLLGEAHLTDEQEQRLFSSIKAWAALQPNPEAESTAQASDETATHGEDQSGDGNDPAADAEQATA
ncbi:MAG: hypothetical protein AAF805_00120 [Planctomycetota bacterium]